MIFLLMSGAVAPTAICGLLLFYGDIHGANCCIPSLVKATSKISENSGFGPRTRLVRFINAQNGTLRPLRTSQLIKKTYKSLFWKKPGKYFSFSFSSIMQLQVAQ
jgi:hypothetical protein